ncbi:double-stranded RNA-specific editase Adar isoform X5 [Drosophila virilis]|uniref:double-stranded RNA-specific editase Adar isoform X5 n=1 Tax=Drosophila virilis TaxID=7244 RepID=UPI001395CD00|nr:double-stranded RNA-specific editase Adar isoform X6 [Drosophila virilis]
MCICYKSHYRAMNLPRSAVFYQRHQMYADSCCFTKKRFFLKRGRIPPALFHYKAQVVTASSEGNMNGYNRKSPQKRRYDMPKYAVPPKKKSGKERVPQPKNTVAMLNELRHGLIYKLESQTGPVHAPLFTISVEVDGQKYMGQGRSKKVARIEAAATALRSFIQFKDGAVLSPLKPAGNLDFTSDEHLENDATKNTIAVDGQKKVPDKGPVMLLYELFNDVNFECMNIDGAQNNCRFKMTVTINDKKFDGTGPSKKLAKNAAAKAALASLCNISYSPMMAPQKNAPLPIDDKSSSMELPQIHADTIGRLVLEKFMEVIKGQEAYSRRKVLAGIVMTENMNFCEAKVISVSTGTKCVSGEHMSVNGAVLNDSHAEIVSRRCLLKYLYAQLDLQCNQGMLL